MFQDGYGKDLQIDDIVTVQYKVVHLNPDKDAVANVQLIAVGTGTDESPLVTAAVPANLCRKLEGVRTTDVPQSIPTQQVKDNGIPVDQSTGGPDARVNVGEASPGASPAVAGDVGHPASPPPAQENVGTTHTPPS